jgi:hypothetical protein
MISTYVDFIAHCQTHNGTFLNYVDSDRNHDQKNNYVNLEDSNGRAVWALGVVVAHYRDLPEDVVRSAEEVLLEFLPTISKLTSPRAMGFAIKGLFQCNQVWKDQNLTRLIDSLAQKLQGYFDNVSKPEWLWFENSLTYANSVLPEAMLLAYLETGEVKYRATAVKSMNFLLQILFQNRKYIQVVSNRGWRTSEDVDNHQFGEQPIDVAYTVMALALFTEVFRTREYKQKMKLAFNWFLGQNHLGEIIYNPVTGGCYDGLEKDRVNINEGAESTVCYLLARLAIDRAKRCKVLRKRVKKNKAVLVSARSNVQWLI